MRLVRVDGNTTDSDIDISEAVRIVAESSIKGSMVDNMAASGIYTAPATFIIYNNT